MNIMQQKLLIILILEILFYALSNKKNANRIRCEIFLIPHSLHTCIITYIIYDILHAI